MKKTLIAAACYAGLILTCQAAESPKTIATGLSSPESCCIGRDGRIYVTEIGEFGKDGDGKVSVIVDGKPTPFATGLDDPKGIVEFGGAFFVADIKKVVKVDGQGKVSDFVPTAKFPSAPLFLNDIAIEPESGTLFVSDSGDLKGAGGQVFRIDVKSAKTDLLIDAKSLPGLNTPNGLTMDGASHLLLVDFGSGDLYRIKLADKSYHKIGEGFEGGDGLTWDKFGQLFISSWKTGKVFGIPRPGQKPVLVSDKQFEQAADTCMDPTGKVLLVPDMKAGTLSALPTVIPGWEVDETPLPVTTEVAFPNLKWTGWSADGDDGRVRQLRLILMTHANDGTNRLFVPQQEGIIHSFPNDNAATKTQIFLDIKDRVRYSDKQNEEGLLGLAFHPKFKTNGEFFVFYTDVKSKMANVVSRFKVSKTDPTKADPASEEEIIRFEKPFWNHDGGTIVFGPDGYLYVTHGDGGAGGDPHENGQKLSTWLGKILRIDIDRKENGKNYAIPKDNPFVGQKDALPELWAYGIRNIWRMSFDSKTGQLWAGEVGQNLYEEIDLIKKGGNYGWFIRESLHPFGAKGVDVKQDIIEPIWEYHHDVGKSITGGSVYRGKKIPTLDGAYIYADYVTTKVWGLWYDAAKGRVIANREIAGPKLPVMSFGEDNNGEIYLLVLDPKNQAIRRVVSEAKR